jgi:hypothetical protein
MIYIYIFNCNWVDTRWQQYSSHLHANSTQSTENRTYITIKKLNVHNNKKKLIWEVRTMPHLCEFYPGVCLTTEEKLRTKAGIV